MKAPVWVSKSSPTPPPLYSHFTPFLLGSYLDSHLYIEESEHRCPRGTREVTLKAAEGFQSMVFHQKSSQTVHSKSLFLGQEEEQTGPLWGSEKEQCHLSCLQGLFRVQPRADQGQSYLHLCFQCSSNFCVIRTTWMLGVNEHIHTPRPLPQRFWFGGSGLGPWRLYLISAPVHQASWRIPVKSGNLWP